MMFGNCKVFLQNNILKDGDDYNGEKLLLGSAWLLLWLQMKTSDSETVTQEFEWTHMQFLIEIQRQRQIQRQRKSQKQMFADAGVS